MSPPQRGWKGAPSRHCLRLAGSAIRRAGVRRPPSLPAFRKLPSALPARAWGLTIERPTIRCGTLRREGAVFLSGQRVAARLPPGTDDAAADFLLRVLTAQGALTLQVVEASVLPIPLRTQDAAAAERALLAAERAALAREQVILDYRAEIDALISPLFEAVPHPPIERIGPLA